MPAAFAAWLCLVAAAFGDVSSRLSSRFLARGERALLEITLTGFQPSEIPVIPALEGIEIRPTGRGPQTILVPGRRLAYVFEYLVSAYEIGSHTVPAFEVMAGGTRLRTEPVDFMVFNPDELKWSEAVAGGTRFRYASAFRAINLSPYEGETTPVEIKIYMPRDIFVEEGGWGIPDFQRDGLTSWRFQPSAMRGEVNLLGMPYVSVAYPSTLTPNRKGKVGIGPATVRLVTRQVVMDGILRQVNEEVNLTVPRLDLESVPLPAGAPEGFENAVGDFRIEVGTTMTEFQEGDPIPVEIIVSGSGNLDTLRPPKPQEIEGWKVYEATTEQRGIERHELSGNTIFKQFLRPLVVKPSLPAFRLVFFDPKTKTYQTITSDPIPVQMKPAAPVARIEAMTPPQALPVPVERMTDILGLLQPASLTRPSGAGIPGWLWHLAGAVLALVLIGKALWMRHGHRFHQDPVRIRRLKELREIESARNEGDAGFLLSAGKFIERWLGENPSPDVKAVLEERDAKCFLADKPAGPLLDSGRRNEILRVLRKASLLWIAAGMLVAGTQRANAQDDTGTQARSAYDAARYEEAIQLWLKAGPYESLAGDTLYNIGNACYRSGSPGHAALYYRRALARDPGHSEARQNLRFIERKYGSITVHRPEYQYAIARLPLSAWKGMLWTGAWLCGLALLVFPATRPGAKLRVAAVAALVIGPLLATSGGLGWRYFPNDAEFASVERQAVIIGEDVVLHADASRTSPEVIDAPAGSLCEVIQESGRWSYVAFATKTRGWVTTESVERILPSKPPSPPRIKKPKVDGKSA